MQFGPSLALRPVTLAIVIVMSGCTVYQAPPPQRVYYQPVPAPVYVQPAPTAVYVEPVEQPVVSVYIEPPISQPPAILVGWAPPPMLVESPPPLPFASAVWTGGYWVWEGNWVWAAGRWAPPPQPNYAWVHPYYENRDGAVVFITGHWSPPGVVFVPPAPGLHLTLVVASAGVVAGPRPIGPSGVFVPAPPGSRLGLIVPAPIGTAPAVVTGAAPIVNVGMRIQSGARNTNVTNVTNINNTTNVTIVAPASAMANGKSFESSVPAQAHLAAAMPAVVRVAAPAPVSSKPIPAFVPGRAPVTLPAPQVVRSAAAPATTNSPEHLAAQPAPPPQSSAIASTSTAANPNAKPAVAATSSKAAASPAPAVLAAAPAHGKDPAVQFPPARVVATAHDQTHDQTHARTDQERAVKAPAAVRPVAKEHDKRKEEAAGEHGEKRAQ
jgi:hypothetical protein